MKQLKTSRKLSLLACLLAAGNTRADLLEDTFRNPPPEARPGVMWMWMGSNNSEAAITRDLEALHTAGFGRTLMFPLADVTTPWAGEIGKSPTPEFVAFTEPWWGLVRHAALESQRLGMEFGMFNGPGYETSGGPWITPEFSMQEVCFSQKAVTGGARVQLTLERPQVDPRAVQTWPIFNPNTGQVEKPEMDARRTYYRDIAVLALPAEGAVAKEQVLVLTDKLGADGKIEWDAPAGAWVVYRFGHTTMGTLMQPAQWKANGLECDKMSAEAVTFHLNTLLGQINKHVGDLIGKGFDYVHVDSFEAGTGGWTPKMRAEFATRRGYDLTPFLATFAKRIVGSDAETAKFRADFNSTIKDLHRDVHFALTAKLLREAGLRFTCEPYGGPWRQEEIMPHIDVVMTEFWTHGGKFSPVELEPTVAALRKSGQNIVECEAFTGDPTDSRWSETPAWLKPMGDAAFCAGADLGSIADNSSFAELHDGRGQLADLFNAMWELGKPTIARVRGYALAGGFGLACACDIVIAADDAKFGTPEIDVGLWPYMITVPLLRSLPPKAVLELMMTGRRIDAAEALRLGCISQVVAVDDLDATVDALAATLAAKPPLTMRWGRDAFYRVLQQPNSSAALDYLQTMLTLTTNTDDAAEGVAAFAQKRAPIWTGH